MSRFTSFCLPGVLIALLATGCASSPTAVDTPATPPQAEAAAALQPAVQTQTVQNRLACYRGVNLPECNLRIYQIMVESFIDADPRANYNFAYGTSHHKGDLQGVINSLDYIKGLGMNAIWLTPVFKTLRKPNQDYWADLLDGTGYYTTDYFQIDPKFGTFRQAKTLVDEAHKRGLYVFFDGAFGHHKDNIVPSPSGLKPAGKAKWVDYPESLAFYKEVAAYWIEELKIDGWRLDQAYQVPVEYWDDLRDAVQQASRKVTYKNAAGKDVHPLGYMVAEIWKGSNQIASSGYGTKEKPALNSAFDFPTRYRLVQTLAVEEAYADSGLGNLPATTLLKGFDDFSDYPDHAMPNLMLSNHDLLRFGDLLQRGGLAQPEQGDYWRRHKAAFAFMAAYSGPITLFYGDEIGQEVKLFSKKVDNSYCASQGLCDDHASRLSAVIEGLPPSVGEPPSVLSAQQKDLKNYVARLMQLRQEHPALVVGSRLNLHADEQLYADLKTAGNSRVLFLLNTKSTAGKLTLKASALGEHGDLKDLLGGAVQKAANGEYTLELAPLEARFMRIQ